MPRAIWKGAITFGLVHVPVALYPAAKDNIVKGLKRESGDYVVLFDDDIRQAYPKSTQTIVIEAFVPAQDISFVYIERPYYLEPVGKGENVYALLRARTRRGERQLAQARLMRESCPSLDRHGESRPKKARA